MTRARSRQQVARQMQRAVGDLTKVSMGRMEREMRWFGELTAEQRAWIGMVMHAGFTTFVEWYRDPDKHAPHLAVQVFGEAPRSFTGIITLQQTVAMVRLTIQVAETELVGVVSAENAADVRESILRYGREIAFATADVYAHAAEMRGAWDARLEALVVDSVMRGDADESIRSRASALGWGAAGHVTVVVGRAPQAADASPEGVVDRLREAAQHGGLEALGAVQGDRLVLLLGGVSDPDKAGALLADHFGAGPVVVGPVVSDLLHAHLSAAEAVAGLRAAVGWSATPALVTSEDLLAERALDGDPLARRSLVDDVYRPLRGAGAEVLATVTAFLDQGGSVEGTARVLYVHPNTVRYRLRRVLDLTGLAPNDARHAFTLRIALVLGRFEDDRDATT
jgi:hypothetical protein